MLINLNFTTTLQGEQYYDSVLLMLRKRHREVKQLAQGHTVSSSAWRSQVICPWSSEDKHATILFHRTGGVTMAPMGHRPGLNQGRHPGGGEFFSPKNAIER